MSLGSSTDYNNKPWPACSDMGLLRRLLPHQRVAGRQAVVAVAAAEMEAVVTAEGVVENGSVAGTGGGDAAGEVRQPGSSGWPLLHHDHLVDLA